MHPVSSERHRCLINEHVTHMQTLTPRDNAANRTHQFDIFEKAVCFCFHKDPSFDSADLVTQVNPCKCTQEAFFSDAARANRHTSIWTLPEKPESPRGTGNTVAPVEKWTANKIMLPRITFQYPCGLHC